MTHPARGTDPVESFRPDAPVAPVADPVAGDWTALASPVLVRRQLEDADGEGPGPFAVAVKANIGVRGFRRSAGCPALDDRPEDVDAPVVAAFRRAGAVVVGTTNMHELAFGILSDNAAFGPVRVAGHDDRSAGGSSGGSAAVVARGLVPLALGTDTGGSVSIPASLCGVVGFRPSVGRWPTAGIVGLSWTRDTPGVFARTVTEAARADEWVTDASPARVAGAAIGPSSGAPTAGAPGGYPGLRPRLGVPTSLAANLDPHTRVSFERARSALESAFEFVDVDLDAALDQAHGAEMPVVRWESRRLLAQAAAAHFGLAPDEAFVRLIDGVASPDVRAILENELAHPTTADAYAAAQRDTVHARAGVAEAMSAHEIDALVFPTTPAPAPRIDVGGTTLHGGATVSTFELYTRNTGPGTILGVPTVTVPIPVGAGALPVGLSLQGRRFDDRALLALAAAVESRLGDTEAA